MSDFWVFLSVAQTCDDCMALQDPYCVWNLASSKCIAHGELLQSNLDELMQDVSRGFNSECPIAEKG